MGGSEAQTEDGRGRRKVEGIIGKRLGPPTLQEIVSWEMETDFSGRRLSRRQNFICLLLRITIHQSTYLPEAALTVLLQPEMSIRTSAPHMRQACTV